MRIYFFGLFLMWILPGLQAQDFSYDMKVGAEAARQVEQMMGTYPDPELSDYVTAVGRRLATGLGSIPFEFRFHVVDMSEPNAFALPGGYIYVSRGLLSLVNTEDELAGVMGHEMVHVTKRHSIKQMKQGIIPGLLRIPGALIGGLVNEDLGRIINAPVNFGSALFLTSYSRKQEKESDDLGIKLASDAGYDPLQLGGLLQRLAADVARMTGEEEKKSYFSTHPYTPKRVDDIREKAPLISWEKVPPIEERPGLYGRLEGMALGENPAHGVFRDSLFMHPDLGIAMVFPAGWQMTNVPVAVAAVEPGGNAQLFMGAGDPTGDPDSLGNLFARELEGKYDIKPARNLAIDVNGYPGHLVSFRDLSGNAPVDVLLYWIRTDSVMLNIMGMGYDPYEKMLSDAATSVRPLTPEERGGIRVMRMRTVEADGNESLQALSDRTGNTWDPETTAIMNDLDADALPARGELVKIAVEEPYR